MADNSTNKSMWCSFGWCHQCHMLVFAGRSQQQTTYKNKTKLPWQPNSLWARTSPGAIYTTNIKSACVKSFKTTGDVMLPDTGDRTMFPDLWTSSNLLKMTLSLDRGRRVSTRWCCVWYKLLWKTETTTSNISSPTASASRNTQWCLRRLLGNKQTWPITMCTGWHFTI